MIVMLLDGAQHAKSFQAQECSGHFRICLYMCVPFSNARLLRSFVGESPMGCTREEGHWYSVQDHSLELCGPLLPLTCSHPLSPLYCFDSITYLQRASLCSPNLHHHSLSKVQFLPVRPMPAPRSGFTTPLQAGFLLLILNTFPKEVQLILYNFSTIDIGIFKKRQHIGRLARKALMRAIPFHRWCCWYVCINLFVLISG